MLGRGSRLAGWASSPGHRCTGYQSRLAMFNATFLSPPLTASEVNGLLVNLLAVDPMAPGPLLLQRIVDATPGSPLRTVPGLPRGTLVRQQLQTRHRHFRARRGARAASDFCHDPLLHPVPEPFPFFAALGVVETLQIPHQIPRDPSRALKGHAVPGYFRPALRGHALKLPRKAAARHFWCTERSTRRRSWTGPCPSEWRSPRHQSSSSSFRRRSRDAGSSGA